MMYRIFVNDARNGTTFLTGFASGYLCADGTLSAERSRAGVLAVPSLGAVRRELEDRGFTEAAGVTAGKATGYAAH